MLEAGDEAAFRHLHRAGPAAALLDDVLVATASRLPAVADGRRGAPEQIAVATLRRLNHPGWLTPDILGRLARQPPDVVSVGNYGPVRDAFVRALSTNLAVATGRGDTAVVGYLADRIAWLCDSRRSRTSDRRALRQVEPALRDALPIAPLPVGRALRATGTATDDDLRAIADRDDAAAAALCRRTGEEGPLIAALHRHLAGRDPHLGHWLHTDVLPAAARLQDAVPPLRDLLTAPDLKTRAAAAHLLLRAGEPRHAPRVIQDALADPSRNAADVVHLARDLALEPLLRAALDSREYLTAARALIDLGHPRAAFTEPVLRWITHAWDHDKIVDVCRHVLDPSAVPRLRDLAERDERFVGGSPLSSIWDDELVREAILAGIDAPVQGAK